MKIRTMIVDDEPLARERLRKLLSQEPDIEIVAECADGHEAIKAIRKDAPALVFLDVQMPEVDGFGVISALGGGPVPIIIFVTAYDKFALRAFEVHALDYLLKPFDRERFGKALDRARVQIQKRQTDHLDARLTSLLEELKGGGEEEAPPKYLDRLAVKSEGRVILLKTDDIDWIEAADNYVSLHIGGESHLHRETMASLESKLPPDKFIRISRSSIVNIDRIRELQPLFHGDHVVILRSGTKLTLSRTYRDKLNQLLGKAE
jgi:two-component system, LytTR family, response regulator